MRYDQNIFNDINGSVILNFAVKHQIHGLSSYEIYIIRLFDHTNKLYFIANEARYQF